MDPSKPVLIPGDPEQNNILQVDKNGGIKYHKNVIKVYVSISIGDSCFFLII